MLTPAQALSGVGSHAPTNIGFLAYNYYQQYLWYTAAKSNQIHALALLPTYLDLIYAVTYLGGIPAGNFPMGILLGLGTAGLLLMNTITAWIALKTNLPEGDEVYQFFFFGWRTLSKGWRRLMAMWQVFDTLTVVVAIIGSIVLGIIIPLNVDEDDVDDSAFKSLRDTAIFWGLGVGPGLLGMATHPLDRVNREEEQHRIGD